MRGLRRREQLRGVGGEGGERSNAVAGPVGGDGAVASVVCVLAIKPDKGGLPTACAKKEGLEPITRSAQGGIFKKTRGSPRKWGYYLREFVHYINIVEKETKSWLFVKIFPQRLENWSRSTFDGEVATDF